MRVWTVPNIITMARIVLIVVFGFLLVAEHDGWAIFVLAVAGVSDFVDGFVARRWNQSTDLGRILDPAADRLLTVVVVLGLALRDIIPWWLVIVLLARDVAVGIALLLGRKRGIGTPKVTMSGKVATAVLYVALPLAYLTYDWWELGYVAALVLATVGAGIYWYSGIGYVRVAIAAREATPDSGTHAPAELD